MALCMGLAMADQPRLSVGQDKPVPAEIAEAVPDVEPASNPDEIPAAYRLEPADRDFLRFTVPIDPVKVSPPHPIPPEWLRSGSNPILRMPDGQVVTVGDLLGWTFSQGLAPEPSQLLDHPDVLSTALGNSAFYRAVNDVAKTEGYEQDDSYRAAVRSMRRRALEPLLRSYAITTRGKPVTADDVRLEYERTKREKFRIAFDFEAYHIFLSGYETYEVQPGDTDLREIARRIAGSELAVVEIRRDDVRRTRRWVPEDRRGELPYDPPTPGERLLVPVDEAGMERLTGRAQEILGRVQAGEDFLELAREYSDAELKDEIIRPAPGQTDSILPEIRIALQATDEGEVTPIIRTKHGLQIFKLIKKRDEGIRPYEEVGNMLGQQMVRQAQAEAWTTFNEDLQSTPLLQIDTKLIQETAKAPYLEDDQVVVRFDDSEEITFMDLFPGFSARDRFRTAPPEMRVDMVKDAGVVRDALYSRFATDHGITEVSGVRIRLDYAERYWLARYHAREWAKAHLRETTPLLHDYYIRNFDTFMVEPRFRLRALTRPVDLNDPVAVEAARAELAELGPTISSEAQFIELVRETATTPEEREAAGLLEGLRFASSLGDELGATILKAESGSVIGPGILPETMGVSLLYVVERADGTKPDFEGYFPLVVQRYSEMVQGNLITAYANSKLRELNAKIEWLHPETIETVEAAPTPAQPATEPTPAAQP